MTLMWVMMVQGYYYNVLYMIMTYVQVIQGLVCRNKGWDY